MKVILYCVTLSVEIHIPYKYDFGEKECRLQHADSDSSLFLNIVPLTATHCYYHNLIDH